MLYPEDDVCTPVRRGPPSWLGSDGQPRTLDGWSQAVSSWPLPDNFPGDRESGRQALRHHLLQQQRPLGRSLGTPAFETRTLKHLWNREKTGERRKMGHFAQRFDLTASEKGQ